MATDSVERATDFTVAEANGFPYPGIPTTASAPSQVVGIPG